MSADSTGGRAMGLLSSFVMEDGRAVGEAWLDAQIADARAVLDQTGPRRHWLGRGRGGSKSTDGSAVALAAMVTQAPAGAQLYVGANDRDQAALVHRAAAGWIRRTPHLRGAFEVRQDRIELPDKGATLTVLPWWVFLDEVAQAKQTANAREFVEALLTALPKVRGSRLLVMTTAGSPLHWSHPMYQAARGSARWRVSDWTPENGLAPTPWQDPEELEEERRSIPAAAFERLFHNRWTGADEAVWDERAIAELVRPGAQPLPPSPRLGPYVVSVDLGLTNDRTAVAVTHVERLSHRDQETGEAVEDGQRVVCDLLRYFEGTRASPVRLAEVENEVVRLARRYQAGVVFDPYQAASMSQNLRDRGIRAEAFNFTASSKQRLASTAINLVRDRAWSLPGDPTLVEELRGLRIVEKASGAFAVDHPPGGHDDGFMACVLGAHRLLEKRPRLAGSGGRWDRFVLNERGRRVPRDDTDPLRFGGLGEAEYIREALAGLHHGGDPRLRGRR